MKILLLKITSEKLNPALLNQAPWHWCKESTAFALWRQG